jgi:predicted MFS family arabinose efflux permease
MMLGMTYNLPFPLLPIIEEELSIVHVKSGILVAAFTLPAIFLSIPVGLLTKKYGARKLTILSLALIWFGLLITSSSNGFLGFLVGRIVSGIGGAGVSVAPLTLIGVWFEERETALAMAIAVMSYNIAFVLGLPVMGWVGVTYGWRIPYLIMTGVGSLVILMSVLFLKEKRAKAETETLPGKSEIRQGLANRTMWTVGICWGLIDGVLITFSAWTPSYLNTIGYGLVLAGLIVSIPWLICIPTNLLGGWVSDRLRKRKMIIVICAIGQGMTVALFPFIGYKILFSTMVLAGIFGGIHVGPYYALPSAIYNPSLVGLGLGILSTCWNLGMTFGPPVFGYFMDLTGGFTTSFLYLGMTAALVVFLISMTKVP